MANLVGILRQEDVSLRNIISTQHIGMFTLLVLEVTPPFRYAEKVGIITFDIASKYSKSLFIYPCFIYMISIWDIFNSLRTRTFQSS